MLPFKLTVTFLDTLTNEDKDMTSKATTPVAVFNRTLAEDVVVPDDAAFEQFWSNKNALDKGVGELDDTAFENGIAVMAYGGIPATVELALEKLSNLEAAAAKAEGVLRQRKAREGVADTPFVVPATFRGYKKIYKDALTQSVELLSSDGHPLRKRDVVEALHKLKDEAATEKLAVDKLAGCTDTWIKILAKCDIPVDKDAIEVFRKMIDDAVTNAFTASV